MFEIEIYDYESHDYFTFNVKDYHSTNFAFLVHELCKKTAHFDRFAVDYIWTEKGTGKEEVINIIFAILDEIDCELAAIDFIVEKHYWKSNFVETLKNNKTKLLTIQYGTLYFIENNCQRLK